SPPAQAVRCRAYLTDRAPFRRRPSGGVRVLLRLTSPGRLTPGRSWEADAPGAGARRDGRREALTDSGNGSGGPAPGPRGRLQGGPVTGVTRRPEGERGTTVTVAGGWGGWSPPGRTGPSPREERKALPGCPGALFVGA